MIEQPIEPPEPKEKCFNFKCIVTSKAEIGIWAKTEEEARERLNEVDFDDADIYPSDILEIDEIKKCEVCS